MTVPRPALSAALGGCTIVIAVDRRSAELASALERHGATVRHAPALTIVSHIDDEALIAATQALIDNPPDVVVATTGVGFRGWMEAADEAGLQGDLHAALDGAQIVARGPKARGAIQHAGLTADWVAESETSEELGAFLLAEGVEGRRVAVQHHGSGADGLDELFTAAGAEVVRLNVGDYQPQFGLRRVLGKGGHETTVPLPEVARVIVNEYLAKERPGAATSEPVRVTVGGKASNGVDFVVEPAVVQPADGPTELVSGQSADASLSAFLVCTSASFVTPYAIQP